MRVKPSTRVGRLTTNYPELAEILGWHGLEPEDDELRLTLEELCDAYQVVIDDVLADMADVLDDDDDGDGDDGDDDEDDDWEADPEVNNADWGEEESGEDGDEW